MALITASATSSHDARTVTAELKQLVLATVMGTLAASASPFVQKSDPPVKAVKTD
jgi:hypothetical protein